MGKGLGKILGAAVVLAAALSLWLGVHSGALNRLALVVFPAAPGLRGEAEEKAALTATVGAADKHDGAPCAVVRVIDGDTVRVRCGDSPEEPVRLVGVDSPEVARQGKPAECGADAASRALVSSLAAGEVFLTPDPEQPDRDRYGRLLRFIATSSPPTTDAPWEGSVNLTLVRAGDSYAYRGIRYGGRTAFYVAEDLAHAEEVGLWGECPEP